MVVDWVAGAGAAFFSSSFLSFFMFNDFGDSGKGFRREGVSGNGISFGVPVSCNDTNVPQVTGGFSSLTFSKYNGKTCSHEAKALPALHLSGV